MNLVGLPHWAGKWNYSFMVGRLWWSSWFLPCGLVQKTSQK
ncbi:hypothetical protein VIA_002811 [Vibrio orientalis CIP 102891 = ATCC 33934]|uniref:Uncharacterized protein n=1 Tax=Vibrio orientalis CIP 102891 = ATCC 33934 TaxID=675816 RepID=A0ABM9YYN2_VIBOR|nr:hypothetical protein VIA_002811 [Vibrio orientalis CIP 102891 = ATCC 33934]